MERAEFWPVTGAAEASAVVIEGPVVPVGSVIAAAAVVSGEVIAYPPVGSISSSAVPPRAGTSNISLT